MIWTGRSPARCERRHLHRADGGQRGRATSIPCQAAASSGVRGAARPPVRFSSCRLPKRRPMHSSTSQISSAPAQAGRARSVPREKFIEYGGPDGGEGSARAGYHLRGCTGPQEDRFSLHPAFPRAPRQGWLRLQPHRRGGTIWSSRCRSERRCWRRRGAHPACRSDEVGQASVP